MKGEPDLFIASGKRKEREDFQLRTMADDLSDPTVSVGNGTS